MHRKIQKIFLKFWQCHYKTEIRYFCLGKSLIVIKNTSKNISRCHVMTFVLFNHFKVGCVSTTDVKLLKLQTNKSISGERNSMMTSLSNQVIIFMWFSECSYSFKLHHKIMKWIKENEECNKTRYHWRYDFTMQ